MAENKRRRETTPLEQFMPFDGTRFFGSPYVRVMRDFQVGWYLTLLWREWERAGYLPDDQEQLWILAGADSKEFFEKHSAIVMGRFESTGDGRLFNSDLLEIYSEKMTKYQNKKRVNKSNAKARWDANGCESDANRIQTDANGMRNDANGTHISVSISNSSSDSKKEEPPDNLDEKVEEIGHLYPGNSHLVGLVIPPAHAPVIAEAIVKHGYEVVKVGTLNYRDAVARWSPSDRKYILNAAKFYGPEAHFLKDPAEWERKSPESSKPDESWMVGKSERNEAEARKHWKNISLSLRPEIARQVKPVDFRSGLLVVEVPSEQIAEELRLADIRLSAGVNDVELLLANGAGR